MQKVGLDGFSLFDDFCFIGVDIFGFQVPASKSWIGRSFAFMELNRLGNRESESIHPTLLSASSMK